MSSSSRSGSASSSESESTASSSEDVGICGRNCAGNIPAAIPCTSVIVRSTPTVNINEVTVVELNCEGLIEGSCPTHFFKGESPETMFALSDMCSFRHNYNVPSHIVLLVPAKEVRADWNLPGMTCLYEYPFRIGFRFPLPGLIGQVCGYYNIAPGQLTPNTWRTLIAIEVLAKLVEIPFTYEEVLTVYGLKMVPGDKGRFQLYSKKVKLQLLAKRSDPDTLWKAKYMFVPFEALGLPPNSGVSRIFKGLSSLKRKFKPSKVSVTEDRLDRFRRIPDEFRDCDFILTELFLRESDLWDLVPPRPEGYKIDKEISSTCGVGSMEDLRRLKKSIEGPLAKRKSQSDASSSAAVQKKKQRVVHAGEPAVADDSITIRYPLFAHAHSDFVSHFEESKKLLWPEDKATFKERGAVSIGRMTAANGFKCLQGMFHMIDEIEQYQAEIGKLRSDKAVLQSNVKSVKFELDKAKALITEQSEQLRLKELDATLLQKVRSEVDDLRTELFVAQTKNKIAAAQAEIKLRAELFQQVKEGKADTWDFKKAFAEKKELEEMMALEAVDSA